MHIKLKIIFVYQISSAAHTFNSKKTRAFRRLRRLSTLGRGPCANAIALATFLAPSPTLLPNNTFKFRNLSIGVCLASLPIDTTRLRCVYYSHEKISSRWWKAQKGNALLWHLMRYLNTGKRAPIGGVESVGKMRNTSKNMSDFPQ